MIYLKTLCVALAMLATNAFAQSFPNRPIHLVIAFPPGQSTDTMARLLAVSMADTLKQPVIVENKPGALGVIAHMQVKNAAPDGYTVLLGASGSLVIGPLMNNTLPYDTVRDYEPVGMAGWAPIVVYVPKNSPFESLHDLVEYANANPGKLNLGSSGIGTTAHLAMEMFKSDAGIDLIHVPYKGSVPMFADVSGGQIDGAFDSAGGVLTMLSAGRIKLLAVAAPSRLASLPDVPTVAEQGYPGFQALAWTGMIAPKGTPADVIKTLNSAINKALEDPKVVETLAASASAVSPGTPDDFRRFIHSETNRWTPPIKSLLPKTK